MRDDKFCRIYERTRVRGHPRSHENHGPDRPGFRPQTHAVSGDLARAGAGKTLLLLAARTRTLDKDDP